MNENKIKSSGGVDRSHGSSFVQRLTFCFGHLQVVFMAAFVLFVSGLPVPDQSRGVVLLACAVLYWLRHSVTLFYLLQRRVDWGEVIGLLIFIALFELGFVTLGAGFWRDKAIPFGLLDYVGIVLVLVGSFLNTGSEVQRKWWKQNRSSKGHCYTGGMFAWSMHINYFGDVVLFTGWALLTSSFWTLILPIFMLFSFMFVHIPPLDEYLRQRYGKEFEEYAATTSKLIPGVY